MLQAGPSVGSWLANSFPQQHMRRGAIAATATAVRAGRRNSPTSGARGSALPGNSIFGDASAAPLRWLTPNLTLRSKITIRVGHPAGRCGSQLYAGAHLSRANPVVQSISNYSGSVDLHRKAIAAQEDLRVGLGPGKSNLAQTEAVFRHSKRECGLLPTDCAILWECRRQSGKRLGAWANPDHAGGRRDRDSRRVAASSARLRRAERNVAAQAEMIGISEADLYPAFTINGTLGYKPRASPTSSPVMHSMAASARPSIGTCSTMGGSSTAFAIRSRLPGTGHPLPDHGAWANEEVVENGLVTFLRAQRRAKLLEESVEAAERREDRRTPYEKGRSPSTVMRRSNRRSSNNRTCGQAQGQIVQGLIEVYRAMGGGWEIRLASSATPLPLVPPQMVEPTQRSPRAPGKPSPSCGKLARRGAGRDRGNVWRHPPAAPPVGNRADLSRSERLRRTSSLALLPLHYPCQTRLLQLILDATK